MSRQSPAVARIVAVLNFFMEHPQQAFTLAQVVKSLRLSRATTHSILLGFVEAGYLYRQPNKSYVLGPILPQLFANVMKGFSPQAVLNQEMRALADEFDVIASALFIEGEEMKVRERAASVNNLGLARAVSGRAVSIYPWGSVFLFTLPDAEIAARLDAVRPSLSPAMRKAVLDGVTLVRDRGFLISFGERGDAELDRDAIEAILNETGSQDHTVSFILVPVVGSDRMPGFAISLAMFREPVTVKKALQIADRAKQAAERVGKFVGGELPISA